MGQKTHPTGLRLGIIKGWESNWFGGRTFADKLIEDEAIRAYIRQRNKQGGISKIVIERTNTRLIVTIHTARPGVVIGRGGESVEKLKEDIKRIANPKEKTKVSPSSEGTEGNESSIKEVQINIYEVKKPECDAALVADQCASQLEARASFRRVMKGVITAAMRSGVGGIKVVCSGRLGGAEMARTESYKEGRIPLQTLRADIDYATATARTIYGAIGIKVWIFKGEIFGKVDLTPEIVASKNTAGRSDGGNYNREGRGEGRGGRGGRESRGGGEGREGRGGRGGTRDGRSGGNRGAGDRSKK